MMQWGSPYLGPDFRGRYQVAAAGSLSKPAMRYAFLRMLEHLRAAGFTEATDSEDLSRDFYVADIGVWTGSVELLLVPAANEACLQVAAAFKYVYLDTFAVYEDEPYEAYQDALARAQWRGFTAEDRREYTQRYLGRSLRTWRAVLQHPQYEMLRDALNE